MSIRYFLDGLGGRALREAEEHQRLLRRVGIDESILTELGRADAAREQLARAAGASSLVAEILTQRRTILDTYRDAFDVIGGASELKKLSQQGTSATGALDLPQISSMTAELAEARSTLALPGVSDVLSESRFCDLGVFARAERETLAAIGAAASQFDVLSAAASFSRLGTAMDAAAAALSAERLASVDYRAVIDPFFGDWTRIDRLPSTYGRDSGARREVIQEIGADDAFLGVDVEEAAALLEESSFDDPGTPVAVLGEPIGLFVAGDPDDVAARLIRRVERALRARIAHVLKRKHGPKWETAVMPERAQSWSEKRAEDEKKGLPIHELIQYSEFPELAMIITERWNDGFAGAVAKASKVTSRIYALAPHRNYEFHSRPVTPEQLIGIVYAVRELEAFLLE